MSPRPGGQLSAGRGLWPSAYALFLTRSPGCPRAWVQCAHFLDSRLSVVLCVVWPILSVPAGVFTRDYFAFWVFGLSAWVGAVRAPRWTTFSSRRLRSRHPLGLCGHSCDRGAPDLRVPRGTSGSGPRHYGRCGASCPRRPGRVEGKQAWHQGHGLTSLYNHNFGGDNQVRVEYGESRVCGVGRSTFRRCRESPGTVFGTTQLRLTLLKIAR